MTLKSVDKAISVLNCFSSDRAVLSVGQISSMTGFTKSSVSRLLATLEQRGCMERAEGVGKYRLGYRTYLWGTIARRHINLPSIARPVMERLRDVCGEQVLLYVRDGDSRISLEVVESVYQIAKVDPVGKHYPLHAGAAGKLILAFIAPAERREIYRRTPPARLTPHTITDIERLEKDLSVIREQDYAVSKGEREPDAFSVNAPVRNSRDEIIASLSLAGPIFRLTDEKLDRYVMQVREAAAKISEKLGYGDHHL